MMIIWKKLFIAHLWINEEAMEVVKRKKCEAAVSLKILPEVQD